MSTTYTITPAEQAELTESIARTKAELAIATDLLERHIAEMDVRASSDGDGMHSDWRKRYALAGDVEQLERRLASAEQFLTQVIVEADPEPEPPTPAAPVARPAVKPISRPARLRVSVAWHYSVCALSGERIRPGDQITNYEGRWCLARVAEAHEARRIAAGQQRRTDQELAACFVSYFDRLPAAA